MTDPACPECGLREETISPPDAKVAIRSYPRRFRALLTSFDRDEHPDSLVHRRPDPSSWSALEHAAYLADLFQATADAVGRMNVEDHPTLTFPELAQQLMAKGYNDEDTEAILDRLRASAERLGTAFDAVPADGWRRTAGFSSGRFLQGDHDILDVARRAVHEGYHQLRDIQRVLSEVRGRPTDLP